MGMKRRVPGRLGPLPPGPPNLRLVSLYRTCSPLYLVPVQVPVGVPVCNIKSA